MSNSHWYHFFLHDAFGVMSPKINFFSGGQGMPCGHFGGACAPFAPPWVRHCIGSYWGIVKRQSAQKVQNFTHNTNHTYFMSPLTAEFKNPVTVLKNRTKI